MGACTPGARLLSKICEGRCIIMIAWQLPLVTVWCDPGWVGI